jgi:hypothetical protein
MVFIRPLDSPYTSSVEWIKLERGNKATDWTPAPEDMLGKATFTSFENTYNDTARSIENRLTAIDSSEEGSVVTRLNKTESTASGNSKLITTINNSYVTQKNIDDSILSDKQIIDTRNTNELPPYYYSNYPKQEIREFKRVSVMGIGSGNYGILTTNVPWHDGSGGRVQQTFDTETEKFTRQGQSGWSSWVKQIDTADTTYQKVVETSNLYERVIGSSSEATVKQNMSRIVMTDSVFQTEVIDRQNLLTAMASGTGMTSDPYFNNGTNGLSVYDNANTGTVKINYTKIPSTTSIPAPKGNDGYRLDITHGASSDTTPNRGGIVRSTMGWVNGTVVVKFVALLPTGRSFSYHNNGLGTGYTHGWLTDNKGTGKWETYMYYYRFGTGSVSSFGHLSVTGSSSAFSWYLSEYDIINVNETSASKITQLADNITLKVSKDDISNQININTQGVVISGNKISLSGQTSVDGAFWAKEVNAVQVKADNISGTTAQFTSLRSNILTADVITSTMIKADTALFDMLFSTQSATNRLSARDAWITNANIVSLDASKITTGTIDAGRLNAGAIVTSGLSANVIKSEHILGSTALIDKIFAQDAYITRLTGKTAFISSIKAIDLSASRITSGTLDASKITVSNLSASSLTTGTLDANRVTINNLSASRITSGTLDASKVTVSNLDASSITANQADLIKAGLKGSSGGSLALSGDQILSTASDGSQVYIQNGLVGTRNPQGATIGQLGYMFDGSSPTYIMRTSLGSHFALNQTFNDTYNGVTTSKEKETIRIMAGGTQYINRADRMDLYSNVYFQQQVSINGANDLAMSGGNINNPYGIYFQHGGRLYTLSGGTATRLDGSRELQFQVNNVRKMQLDTTRNYMYQPLNMQGNGIFEQSDERIKENIREISQNSLEIIKGTRFANYEMIKDGRSTFGFIAQQLQTVAPHLIFEEDGRLTYDTVEWTQTVAHGLQQLNNKVDENDNKVNNIIKKLESKIEMLELELKRARG